jgi:hypothetical protein
MYSIYLFLREKNKPVAQKPSTSQSESNAYLRNETNTQPNV